MLPSSTTGASARILIVDDKQVNIEALTECLAGPDYQIITARDGPTALVIAKSGRPSLVLLDIVMPGMDGYEVCRRLKGDPDTAYVPVLLLTALTDPESRKRGVEAGADDFLSRPIDRVELTTRVSSLLRIQSLYDALQASNATLSEALQERTKVLERTSGELQTALQENVFFAQQLAPGWHARLGGSAAVDADEQASQRAALRSLKQALLSRLSDTLDGRMDLSRTPEIVAMLGQRLAAVTEASGLDLPVEFRPVLFREIVDELVGYGPLETLLADDSISEIMVNSVNMVYVERDGHLIETDVHFDDDNHVLRIIDRIIRPLGRRIDRKSPTVDARLPDGSRVNAIIAPCAIDGSSITIRKFRKDKLTIQDLIKFGSVTPQAAEFLKACVAGRLNIVVSGGTGSGKTTLLNVLSSFIPDSERIVTIEDSAELQLHQRHTVRLETKPPEVDGSGEVSIRALVRNALRMRPDRIVIGEVRGGEALDMLQAMNTGHDGSLATVHANTPRDSLSRLETLVLMAGMDLPLKVARSQIASAVNLIVQQARLRDGSRKVTSITEVQGMEGDVVVLSDLFQFRERGGDGNKVVGVLEATGLRPKFSSRLEASGLRLPGEMFAAPGQASVMVGYDSDRLRRR